ncbi:hypothetical protein BCR35DRAFT_306334 [Leucosporidium creatinivorum]|uniref:Uncharacterized protein n=1 Tax=Leucosporidium creatinivorum TaxID=106004 RepID=A0A1Y2EUV6_9BASI|nr:hypothetical protein BCR35DRAFT_306334 [Leucosporidium creatinivorum]
MKLSSSAPFFALWAAAASLAAPQPSTAAPPIPYSELQLRCADRVRDANIVAFFAFADGTFRYLQAGSCLSLVKAPGDVSFTTLAVCEDWQCELKADYRCSVDLEEPAPVQLNVTSSASEGIREKQKLEGKGANSLYCSL